MSERTGDVLAAGRLACSEQALPQLRRWVELLLVADRTVAARAAQAARRLPDPRSCREPWRQAGATIVADPERRAQLDAIGERLARAEVLRAAGKYRDALDLAVELRGELEALGDRPALVPALRLLGQLRNENSDYPGAETDFGQAFHLALATGLDMQAIEAALASAQVVGRLQRRAGGEAWLRLAEALQTRVGESAGRERYRLAQVRGAIAYAARRWETPPPRWITAAAPLWAIGRAQRGAAECPAAAGSAARTRERAQGRGWPARTN